MEYAIVDIETTGGYAGSSRITEIAIVVHDGSRVVERWESLVDPGQPIPVAITALTGIDDYMVCGAPSFEDIAGQVYRLLERRIFVAHNVNFDYSFVKHELEKAGYTWSARKLCTVRMARKIRPGLPSYSLGRLCGSLSIPISNRHRAGGDADATAVLFGRLLEWDGERCIDKMLARSSSDQRLPPHLPREEFDGLPDTPGIYYFHDKHGKVIYVGKAVNIKKRVASHFTGHTISRQRQHFLREIHHISFEASGTELIALLRECAEIKRLWPVFNRALKRFEPKFGLFTYQGQSGYRYLCVGKIAKHHPCLHVFGREYDGIRTLQKLAAQFGIDRRFCRFGRSVVSEPLSGTAAGPLLDVDAHNARVTTALEELAAQQPTFYILDKGRGEGEQSCVWVERGQLYGVGYLDPQSQLVQPSDIRDSLTRMEGNQYMMQLVFDYAHRNANKVHYC